MNVFVFTKQAKKSFGRLPESARERILAKLKGLKSHPDLFSILRPLINFEPATHRLRIGEYRLVLGQGKNRSEFWVLDVGHRKEVYK